MATLTGGKLYAYFANIQIQGSISTDSDEVYFLPLNGEFKNAEDIEDWVIKTAKEIEKERL